jgi:hypothetical protein
LKRYTRGTEGGREGGGEKERGEERGRGGEGEREREREREGEREGKRILYFYQSRIVYQASSERNYHIFYVSPPDLSPLSGLLSSVNLLNYPYGFLDGE